MSVQKNEKRKALKLLFIVFWAVAMFAFLYFYDPVTDLSGLIRYIFISIIVAIIGVNVEVYMKAIEKLVNTSKK